MGQLSHKTRFITRVFRYLAVKAKLIVPEPSPAYTELCRRIEQREATAPKLRLVEPEPLWKRRIAWINEKCDEAKEQMNARHSH